MASNRSDTRSYSGRRPDGVNGGPIMCRHAAPCPDASTDARDLAAVVSSHPEQGWSLLCNGVVLFDDGGELLPDGSTVDQHHAWLIPA
jgi:hypothetical protein